VYAFTHNQTEVIRMLEYLGSTNDEAARGVEMVDSLVVEQVGWNDRLKIKKHSLAKRLQL
jgi:hypothetical protein